MTTTTTHQSPISTIRLIGLFAVLAWGLLVIVGPLSVALLVHAPAGHYGMAVGCVVLAGILGSPWVVFGLPVICRFFAAA